jgi:hypothetical protein
MGDVFLEVLLALFVNPLFEVVEVESVWVADFTGCQPFVVALEVISNFLSVEDTVDHVAAEQTKLDFVSCVGVDLLIFMDGLEDVGCCGSICKFKLIKCLFGYL